MRLIKFLAIALSALQVFCGCSQQETEEQKWMQQQEKLKVLCTLGMIDNIVKDIGGEHVATWTLVRGELDPHSYQLVKGDDEKLAAADLIFCNGLGLEHGPSLQEYLTSSGKAFCIGDFIRHAHPELILYVDKTPDPHIWMDIGLWAAGVSPIAEILATRDPKHADQYRQNAQHLVKKMLEEHERLQQEMQTVPENKRFLITSHDAFNYFTRSYLATENERKDNSWQKRFAAPEGLAPESQLSTTDIRNILDHMKKYHIRVIFPESNVSKASIHKLLDAGNEEGMSLTIAPGPLYGDAMGAPGSNGDTYLKMIRHDVKLIKNYLDNYNLP